MKHIPLTQGQFATVDDEDYEWLSRYRWWVIKSHGKFMAAVRWEAGKQILMHRQIMNAPKGMEVDHINHNVFDNRKENLRICSRSQNAHNRSNQKGKSRFKGVCWHRWGRKWYVQIQINGKNIYLGLFNNEIDAAKTYDEAAKKYFGEFANTNF